MSERVKPAYTLAGKACSREAFYAAACDPLRPVVVQACAGAGKTWMLVSRILRALLAGAEPHEILAITFTKKAAGEMRSRLNEWLLEFSTASDEKLAQALSERGLSDDFLSKNGGLPAQKLRTVLSNLYQVTLQSPRGVQIRTFHSWFATLVKHAPLAVLQELGLPPAYELLEDDAQAIRLVWPRFYTLLQRDAGLHATYRAAVADVGRWGVQEALTNALGKRTEFALADRAGVLTRSMPRAAEAYPEFAALDDPLQMLFQRREVLLAAARVLGAAPQKSFAAKGQELEICCTQARWRDALICLLTAEGAPRKFNAQLVSTPQVSAAQTLCGLVNQASEQQAAFLHQQRMSELTRALIACFADLKRERGWVDMNDLEQAALHLLRDEQLSGWVQQRLDAQLRHVLIDEFQDTNPLQWQALQSWLSSYVGSGGGREGGSAPSVFIVGDAKQSIYRFRRAEPQVFEAATQFVCEQLGGTLLSCDHTRRNAQGVVALVNAVMSQAATELPYAFRPHTTESEQTGEIIRLPLAPQPEKALAGDEMVWRDTLTTPRDEPQEYAADAECQLAARWVAGQIAQGLIGPDIMVLARKRDRLERMRDALRLLGVASQITEKTALIDLPEVQDVVALLDAVVSPGNDLALARALRSPLLGWRDDDLVALALAVKSAGAQAAQASAVLQDDTNKTISWWDMLTKEEHSAHILCRLDANLASKTRLQLLQLQSLLQALPPHDALSRMVSEQDWVARCMAAAPAPLRQRVQQSLHALLAAALEIGAGRFLTPHKFVRELKKPHLKAPQTTSADDAVRLMTIHGAKGLEAHTVLLLDSLSAPPAAAILDVLVDWPGAQAAPQTFTFLRSEAKAPECVSAALALEQEQRAREEINAMYVAMTRAKSRLVFSAHESARQAATGCLWRRLEALPESVATLIEDAWAGDFAALPQTLSEDTFTLNIMPNERLAGTEYAQSAIKKEVNQATDDDSSSSDASHWGDEVQRRIGIAMHRLLELYRPGADWHESIASVTAAVQLSEPQALQALESAQRIVHGEAAWVWGDAVDWQANEVELFHEAQVLRLDRLVRRRDTQAWWVIDYKSSDAPQHNRALRLQLTQYVEAVKSAFSESGKTAVVHAAFITAQGRWVQIL